MAICSASSHNNTYVLYGGSLNPGRLVENAAPFSQTFSLDVISPDQLPVGNYTVHFTVSMATIPAGVTTAQALSYLTISPSTVSFTGPSQTQPVTVTVSFPAGATTGAFNYVITTTAADWPSIPGYTVADAGVYINATVDAPQATASAPSIMINSPPPNSNYTYAAGGPALQIPFSYTATTASTDPVIDRSDADVSGSPLTVSLSGLNSRQVTGTGTIQVSAAGTYTLNVRAHNSVNTSQASEDFTVTVTGTAPAVSNLTPADGATFTFVTGAPALQIPVSCTATSAYGGIQSATATLNGVPITGFAFAPSAPGSLTGTASSPIPLQIAAGGSYTLVVTVTDSLGTTSATSHFTVVQVPPPTITISKPLGGAPVIWPSGTTSLSVPLAFAITAGSGNITAASVTLNGVPLAASISGIGTPSASFNGSLLLTAIGSYTLAVTATDANATTTTTSQFTVTQVAPPTVTISQPTSGASIVWPVGTTSLSLPLAFTAAAGSGNITAATATLNGVPVALAVTLGTPTLSFSGSIPVLAPGAYTLTVTVVDAYSPTVVSTKFSVVQPTPPVIGITQPTNGAVYTRQAGSSPTSVPFAFTATESTIGTVGAVGVTVNGSPVTATISGLNTAKASGSGSLSISAAGTYTLAVTATSGGAQGSGSVTFTVNQTSAPPPVRSLLWLPPILLNKPFQGGSTIPVAFCILDAKGNLVRDTSIVVAVSEDGGSPDLFTYGAINDHDDSTYAIVLFVYGLNYGTDRGNHTYRIDVYNFWPVGSNNPNLIGTQIVTTKGGSGDDHGDGIPGRGGHGGGDDDHGGNQGCDNGHGGGH